VYTFFEQLIRLPPDELPPRMRESKPSLSDILFWALVFVVGLIGLGLLFVAYNWWTAWGLWDASLWQAPLFLIGMLVLIVLVLYGAICVVTVAFGIFLPLGFALVGMGIAFVLRIIAGAMSARWLGPFLKITTAAILGLGLHFDLLSS
jgi:hypothetical protein